jgi:hypothetical protein
MFKTELREMQLSNLNTRTEKHGPENVGAADLSLQFEDSNKILELFEKGLVKRFYRAATKGDVEVQPELDMKHPDYLPILQCKKIKKISWEEEYPGYRLRIMNQLNDDECDVLLVDAELKGFTFELKEGGTVIVKFKVGCTPQGKDVAYLFEHLGSNISVTLEPPSADKQAELAAA